jgi:eukaryotic-like serine/threonine-protein kinase
MLGTLVSHYRVLHPLGTGGMGEVYAGLDETLKRRVALKAIRPEHRLEPESQARFLREARILSQLDHPNICRVYDYIEGDERDWLVLELIEGKSLKTSLKAGIDGTRAMQIAQQIANVLVATHAAGVVHRDLKPANVMLTGHDHVKVLDFGLAFSHLGGRDHPQPEAGGLVPGPPLLAPEDVGVTQTAPSAQDGSRASMSSRDDYSRFETSGGLIMGTLAYMSPEQARGEPATTASDMFSFGLLVQELFTGRHPHPEEFDGPALLARVQRGETDVPAGVTADLAALIRRLASPLPAQRPTAVDALDRLRWIADKPKRRIRALAIAAVLVLAAAGGVKYTLDLARERTAAVMARDEANQRREQAESLIEFMLGDLRKKLEPVGRLEILDDVGAKAMGYFAAVPEALLTDKELLRRSTALYQIGSVRIAQGRLDAATRPLQESLALAATLSARKPGDTDRLFELGQSHFWVGFVHWRRRMLDEALVNFGEYLRISQQLVAGAPDRADWAQELAAAHSNIGSVLQERGDLAGALERFRACLGIEERMLAVHPDDNALRRAVASSHNSIGVVLRRLGRLDEALAHHQAELALQQELVRRDPANANWQLSLAVAHNYVGNMLDARGSSAEAAREFRTAIDILEPLVHRDPTNMTWRRELGRNHLRLGRTLLASGAADAGADLQESVAILDAIAASDPTNVSWQRDAAEAHHARGETRLKRNDVRGAQADADAAKRAADALLAKSPDDRDAARVRTLALLLTGDIQARRGDAPAARGSWQQSLVTIEPLATESQDHRLLEPWARALLRLGRQADAERVVQRLESAGYRSASLSEAARGTTRRQPVHVR